MLVALCLTSAACASASVTAVKDQPQPAPAAAEPSAESASRPAASASEARAAERADARNVSLEMVAANAPIDLGHGLTAQPSVLLKLSEAHRHVLLVDLPRARLYLLENTAKGVKVIRQHYAAMGKNGFGKQLAGDNRTPVGIYTVSGYRGDGSLPAFYGPGAFPLNYPNDWDFAKKRTGSGIWLHGVPPNTYTRAPRSSEGCVTMANDDLLALRQYLKAGETPVILTDRLDWLSPSQLAAASGAITTQIENWRSKWSAIDTKAYLDFYADDFHSAGLNKAAFSEYKFRVNSSKKRIKVDVRDLDLFAYPGEDNLVLAEFTQDYDSDNYRVSNRKQQFWKKQADGSWKILLEESR